MKREIKFRGLRVKYEKGWHDSAFQYGNLLNVDTIGEVGAHLNSYEYAEVKPETVGQYTGQLDKNGKEIYEDDIVKVSYGIGKVIFAAGCFMIEWIDDQECLMELLSMKNFKTGRPRKDLEVMRNIHENPELLKL